MSEAGQARSEERGGKGGVQTKERHKLGGVRVCETIPSCVVHLCASAHLQIGVQVRLPRSAILHVPGCSEVTLPLVWLKASPSDDPPAFWAAPPCRPDDWRIWRRAQGVLHRGGDVCPEGETRACHTGAGG